VFTSLTRDPDNQYLMLDTTLFRAHQEDWQPRYMFPQIPRLPVARANRLPMPELRPLSPSKASRKIPSYPYDHRAGHSLHLFISASSRQRYDLDPFNLESFWPCDLLISAKLLAWRATLSW